jgi:AcrR family transcriptional regulator
VPATQTRPKTQEERTETAKNKIRVAALELFALQGYEVTTLADISKRAGYSRALAQYHYADKETLALELLETRLRGDLNADLLKCAPSSSAKAAWALLQKHLEETSAHFRALHGKKQQNLLVRGEMVLHHAALMSTDPQVKERVNSLTGVLLSRVAHILEICRREAFIGADVDVHAASVFYVHAIWGLATALFANPKGEKQIGSALAFLGTMLGKLRTTKS